MDENLSRGYVQLGKNRNAVNDIRFTMSHLSPPVDRCNCIYMALMLAGVGFLLPYNSFIIAVDYFQSRFPGTTIVFDMSLVYILMACCAVLANNLLVETLSLNTRITFGYVVSFFTLLFVATCEIWWEIVGPAMAYKMNLFAVAIVALGCTGAAGFLVSANRIITKLLLDDQRANTVIFFVMSILTVALCFVLHQIVRRSDFVRFYLALCDTTAANSRIVLEPHEDMGLMDPLESGESRHQYGVLELQQSPPPVETSVQQESAVMTSAFSFANPVYEPGAVQKEGTETRNMLGEATSQSQGPTFKVEDVVIRMGSGYGGGSSYTSNRKPWSGVKRGIQARWEVAKLVWPYMVAIGAAYFVTLCLYPGIEAEIVSCRFGSWMPVILMAIFNAADLIGKVLASIPWAWSRGQLLGCAAARILLVPLLLLCAAPRHMPFIPGDGFPMFFSALLGLTNGVIGSVPMIQAPGKVSEEYRELTGNIMTLSYNLGLALGSSVAYLLDEILGPPILDVCTMSPFLPRPPRLTTPATLTSTTSVTSLLINATAAISTVAVASMAPAPAPLTLKITSPSPATIFVSTLLPSVLNTTNTPFD